MTAERLIDRLQGVRVTGRNRYMAKCPAHDDMRPSLSVKFEDDGRVLIHCFAGCEPEAILSAADLSFSDLYPETPPAAGVVSKPQKWLNSRDALESLVHEALVVAVIGADIVENKGIDDETWHRLASSVARIHETRDKFAPAKFRFKGLRPAVVNRSQQL